ncbi:MAG: DapH/DapD/GlmU-related protein [Clostridia bacterium]|nr:DapH/DapD/GlmU-related protein [Clostridia bacterium]
MKYRIETKDYFAKFENEKVLGMTPAEHLMRKLDVAGHEYSEDSHNVYFNDMFYLDSHVLAKGPGSAAEALDEIHTGMQFHNAVTAVRMEINTSLVNEGVRLLSIEDSYIDVNVRIGKGTVIYPNTYISGDCRIGSDCSIGPDSMVSDSIVGDRCRIIKSVVTGSELGDECKIGPFSHIRPENVIGNRVKVGAFAEVKKSEIKAKTVIPHLAYVGDSDIGRNCNISCGVITANYDGKVKSRTTVGDNAFVGCNTTLIAPVTVEKDSYIAAGSTVTEDVGEGDLAIARNRQVNKKGWVEKTGRKRVEKP